MSKRLAVKKILVPLDLQQPGECLLKYAGKLAASCGAELLLVQTTNTTELTFTQQSRYTHALRMFGERVLGQLPKSTVTFDCLIRPGNLQGCVKSITYTYHIDLVLMQSVTLSEAEQAAASDHAAAIMNLVACPVMVVPATIAYKKPKHLVFATDFTDQENRVLKQIVALGAQLGAKLTLVQVYAREERSQLAQYKVAMLALQKQLQGNNVCFKLLEEEDVLEGIGDFAELAAADMLVLATQDNYLMQRLFSSNYTKTMAYHTRIPLLSYRQQKNKPCSGCCTNCTSKLRSQQEQGLIQIGGLR